MKKATIAIVSSLVLIPTISLANNSNAIESNVNFSGPADLSSVMTLIKESSMFSDEKDVIVEGHFLSQISKDTYLFSDGEGQIEVEVDDDIHLMTPINSKTKLRIYGEFEGGSIPEIEAEHIQIL
ncbi:hypothetical protein Sps_01574 [Shewanella psychrophila]|uniref:Uncharacterized protein n=2 Tax=Shewanella psychrophila TaxID=225848 RepID=A0A1S6HMK5_9GAMM|nr:hypothetical protein Sps_01574 [Shewanella psychrophila]